MCKFELRNIYYEKKNNFSSMSIFSLNSSANDKLIAFYFFYASIHYPSRASEWKYKREEKKHKLILIWFVVVKWKKSESIKNKINSRWGRWEKYFFFFVDFHGKLWWFKTQNTANNSILQSWECFFLFKKIINIISSH